MRYVIVVFVRLKNKFMEHMMASLAQLQAKILVSETPGNKLWHLCAFDSFANFGAIWINCLLPTGVA